MFEDLLPVASIWRGIEGWLCRVKPEVPFPEALEISATQGCGLKLARESHIEGLLGRPADKWLKTQTSTNKS